MCKSTSSQSNRRGVATLEFVMALPLLFVLMICIMWEGFWLIGLAEVLITARNDAWTKRFDNAADEPLMFPVLDDPAPLDLYHPTKDYVTKKASTKVKISPAFDMIPGPEASHTILAGSWDFQAMPLNKPPDFVLMGKAAILGGFGSILDLAASISDPLGLVEKFTGARKESEKIDRTTKDAADRAEKEGTSGGSGTGSGTGAGGSSDGKTPEQAKQESKDELERQKKAVRERFKALGGKVSFGDNIVVTPVNGELGAARDAVTARNSKAPESRKLPATRLTRKTRRSCKKRRPAPIASTSSPKSRSSDSRLSASASQMRRKDLASSESN